MYLKISGLCILLGIITENVEARHLSGRRFPSLFGSQGFPFSRPFGDFQTGSPGLRQPGFPLRRTRRIGRFPALETSAFSPFGLPPVRPQFGRSRISPRPFGLNPSRGQIGRFGRPSIRFGPTGSSLRRRIPGQFIGAGPRSPFAYYGRQNGLQNVLPRSVSSGRTMPRNIISQLRQRFGSTSGMGTRANPIRIRASLPSSSITSPRGSRPQLRQGVRQPLQRVSSPESRRIQLSRARQQLQPKQQEEVLALFALGSSGLPTLSETIDKQVQVKRTPIKKSPSPKSKSTVVPVMPRDPKTSQSGKVSEHITDKVSQSGKVSEHITDKVSQSGKVSEPITDAYLEKLDIHQLEKLANEGLAAVTETQSAQTSQHVEIIKETTIQADVAPVHDAASQQEIKHVAQITGKQTITSEAVETTSPVQVGTKEASAKSSINAIITDADNVNININGSGASADPTHTGNDIAYTAGVNSISSSDKLPSSRLVVDNVGVPVPVKHIGEQFLETAAVGHISEPVALYADHSHIETPAKTVAVDPEGISVIADKAVSSEFIIPVETAASTETAIPIESTVTSENNVPVESGSTIDVIVPAESIATSESVVLSSEIIIPIESAAASEVIVPVESVPSEIIVPVETAPSSELTEAIVPVETLPSEIIVPVETAFSSETGVPIERVSSGIIVPVETVSSSETVVPVERVSSEIIIPVETVSSSETGVPVESIPSEIIVPVEAVLITEALVPVENVLTSEITAQTETTSSTKIVVPEETAASTEILVPVETVAATDFVVPVETASTAELKVMIEGAHSTESVVPVETAPSSEIIIPVEITSRSHAIVTSQSVVPPAETVANSETIIPQEHVPIVEAVVQTEVVPTDTKQQTHVIASKKEFSLHTSPLGTQTTVLS